jgi:hypothetical protein
VTMRLLAESLLIVASVLLALAVDEWRESRSDQERLEVALESFERELADNRTRIKESVPYHVVLRDRFNELASGPAPGSLQEAFRSIPEWQGIGLPGTLDVAWDAALASQVFPHMDYDLITALARVYRQQRAFERRGAQGSVALEPQNLRPSTLPYTMTSTAIFMEDIVAMEVHLYCMYGRALEAVREHRGVDPEAGPPAPDTLRAVSASGEPLSIGC